MSKRRASAYAKCVGRYLKSHHRDGSPTDNMRSAAAACKGGRKRYYPKGRKKNTRR